MNYYSLKSIEALIERYVNDHQGSYTTIEEGTLGLGLSVLHDAPGCHSYVIKEHYVSAWSSGHTVRQYKVLPKKYERSIELLY